MHKIIIYILAIILSFFLLAIDKGVYSDKLLYASCFIILISLINFIYVNYNDKRFKGKYIRITYLFILGFIVFFFQRNIDLAFGYINIYNDVFCNTGVINKCFIISSIAFCSFGIGNYIAYRKRHNYKVSSTILECNRNYIIFQKLLLTAFLIIFFIYRASDIISGNYRYNEETMSNDAGSLANYSNVMIYVLTFTILVTNCYYFRSNKRNVSLKLFLSQNGWICNALMLFYLLLNFIVGDRGPIITLGLAYLFAYIVTLKKTISFKYLIILVISIGFVFTVIGHIRRETNAITIKDMLNYDMSNQVKSISPMTVELAGSYNTFTYTLANIPDEHDYFYGLIQLREICQSLPFFHRLIPFMYSQKSYENSSSNFCSYLIQGLNRTYGNGSSLLANIYMDFGILGIMIIMYFLGKFCYRLDVEMYRGGDIYWSIVSIVFFSFSIYISRATLTTPLYYIIPSFLIVYLRKFVK